MNDHYEDYMYREQTGEYQGLELHWCSKCEKNEDNCTCPAEAATCDDEEEGSSEPRQGGEKLSDGKLRAPVKGNINWPET